MNCRGSLFLLLCGATAFAQPKVESVRNAASFLVAGMPHYGLAQGAVIVVDGKALGPEEPIAANLDEAPLTTRLAEVSIRVDILGKSGADALIYRVSSTRVTAILPSSTPTGDGVLTLTYGDGVSQSIFVKVVEGAFGITTVDGTGVGTASAYFTDASQVTFLKSANAGETVVLEGTGMGADSHDETTWIEDPTSMPDEMPFAVYFGSIQAEVVYHGRSRRPGWDRIEVIVPEGVNGCYTSVYTKTGTFVSNFTTLPVAAEGRICKEQGFSPDDVEGLFAKDVVNAGWLQLGQFKTTFPAIGPVPSFTDISDSANAGFIRNRSYAFSNFGGRGDPSYGSCVLTSGVAANLLRPQADKFLDAGPFITLDTPKTGSVRLLKETPNPSYVYSSQPPNRPQFIPAEGGTFRFHSDGGEDVGPVDVTLKTTGPFVWANRDKIIDVNRASGLEITWTGGDEDTYMVIYGVTGTQTDPPLYSSFNCSERTSAGKFTIPADVLSSMLANPVNPGPFSSPGGQLALINYRFPQKFTADGLDVGNLTYYFWDLSLVNYR